MHYYFYEVYFMLSFSLSGYFSFHTLSLSLSLSLFLYVLLLSPSSSSSTNSLIKSNTYVAICFFLCIHFPSFFTFLPSLFPSYLPSQFLSPHSKNLTQATTENVLRSLSYVNILSLLTYYRALS